MSYKKSLVIANVIVFSSLAVILTFMKAEVPFPLLPYLKFDFAEIPVMIVLLLLGPIPSLITEVIHWISLTAARGWILGPLMKFLVVTPMIIGFWLGIEAYRRFRKVEKYGFTVAFIFGMVLGITFRVVVCSITNILVFLFVAPEYLSFAELTLRSVGINVSSAFEVWVWTLVLTGVFNMLHVPISSIIATVIFKGVALRLPGIAERAWARWK